MTTLTMPTTPKVRMARFGLISTTQAFRSPLNGVVQTLELSGARWQGTWSYPPMERDQIAAWQAFLVKLRGMAGRFNGFDPKAVTPRGTATGTPAVKGGSQTGASLITDGWTAGVTGIMKAGDYFSVGGELKMVTADANSDGSGDATLAFEPPLRASPSNDAPLTVTSATATMMLADDNQAQWDIDLLFYEGLTFSGLEAFT